MLELLAAESWPFLFAAGLLLALAVIEGIGLITGLSPTGWIDAQLPDIDHPDGIATAILGWLHVGRAPILALLIVFLAAFAVSGFALQLVGRGLVGHLIPAWVAAPIAFFAALPVVRTVGALIAKLIPKDESTAISDASLVGRVAIIVIGTARAGQPAQARVRDEFNTTHYVMVEPESSATEFPQGSNVLLVRQLNGRRFHAILNPKPELL